MTSATPHSRFRQTTNYKALRYLTDPLRIGYKIRRRLLKHARMAYDNFFD